jgi:multidrug transporter EmrE-like cation transporter
MNVLKVIAILLIVAGTAGLAYGGFSFTRETHTADLGPLHLQVNEKQRVNIPSWAGVAAIVGGVVLLVSARKA